MKEKFKKLGVILLFVLFALSFVCLISSCVMKSRSDNKKLDLVKETPKMALYQDNTTGHYISNNLFENLGSSYTYNLKKNIANYNTTTLIHLDTIKPNYRNYFGGDRLRVKLKTRDLSNIGATCYIYFTSISCSSTQDINNLPAMSYSRHSMDIFGFESSYTFDVSTGLLSNDNIYVYLVKTNYSNFNNTNIQLSQCVAFTYRYGDTQETIDYLSSFDYYGLFVPASYNEDIETSLTNSYNQGYSYGEEAGYNRGYLTGYNTGLNSAENNGFDDMMSAVADTPFKILYNLLNFEIFGVNLWVFITSLLSIIVVMYIIKKIK